MFACYIQDIRMTLFEALQGTPDWETKYQILIEAGVQLPEFPESLRTTTNRITGCTAPTWLTVSYDHDRLQLQGYSKSHIVLGLIALLRESYTGLNYSEVKLKNQANFAPLAIDELITATRVNGFGTMIRIIKSTPC